MDPVTLMLFIIAGGVLVGICVHFIPASAVGAMSASTGIATGPSMLSFGAGLTGCQLPLPLIRVRLQCWPQELPVRH